MRLKQYILNEELSDDNLNFIKKNCKPYINLVKKNNTDNVFLYRGAENDSDFSIKKVRKDRRPRDTKLLIHTIIDEIFFKKFGWRARSNSLFCNPDEDYVDIFGKPNIVIPIGKFDYLWSPKVDDLSTKINTLSIAGLFVTNKESLKAINVRYNMRNKKNLTIKQFHDFLVDTFDNFIKKYNYQKNKGFKDMMDKHSNEVMIHCDKYVISKKVKDNYYKLLNEILG